MKLNTIFLEHMPNYQRKKNQNSIKFFFFFFPRSVIHIKMNHCLSAVIQAYKYSYFTEAHTLHICHTDNEFEGNYISPQSYTYFQYNTFIK